jgi:hypothetical protein
LFVLVSPGSQSRARAAVHEPQDLSKLHVELRDVSDEAAGLALAAAGLGRLDGDHAWLDVSALRAMGGGTPDWGTRFDAMLGYARRQGWTDEMVSRVRAHVVRT